MPGQVKPRAYRPTPWRTERKQLRRALERITTTRDDALVLAGSALNLLMLACDVLATQNGRTRDEVLEVLINVQRRIDARS